MYFHNHFDVIMSSNALFLIDFTSNLLKTVHIFIEFFLKGDFANEIKVFDQGINLHITTKDSLGLTMWSVIRASINTYALEFENYF